MVDTFSERRVIADGAITFRSIHIIHSNDRSGAKLSRRVNRVGKGVSMSFRTNDAAIDEIVANCGGDLRGALKALLLVNEHLEAELAQLYAVAAHSGLAERRNSVLH